MTCTLGISEGSLYHPQTTLDPSRLASLLVKNERKYRWTNPMLLPYLVKLSKYSIVTRRPERLNEKWKFHEFRACVYKISPNKMQKRSRILKKGNFVWRRFFQKKKKNIPTSYIIASNIPQSHFHMTQRKKKRRNIYDLKKKKK